MLCYVKMDRPNGYFELNPDSPTGWSYVSKKGKVESRPVRAMTEADRFFIDQSVNHLDPADETDHLKTLCQDQCSATLFYSKRSSYFKHNFPKPGHFDKVQYEIEAISKYQHYFDEEHHFWGGNQIHNQKNPFSIRASFPPTAIKKSLKPSKPVISSIIPIFTTLKDGSTNTFDHQVFRVYLGSSWYETGLGEKLAVIYHQQNPLDADPHQPIITNILANDPTSTSMEEQRDHPIPPAPSYIDQPVSKLDPEFDIRLLPVTKIPETGLPVPTNYDYNLSAFEVQWDQVEGQFYADIRLLHTHQLPYSALARFTVCRYQEQSIAKQGSYDFWFSEPVVTDMVSILPKRSLNLRNNAVIFNRHKRLGKRNKVDKGTEENRYFILLENAPVNGEVADLKKDIKSLQVKVNSKGQLALLDNTVFEPSAHANGFSEIYLEEYEFFPMDDYDPAVMQAKHYNPRNDLQMRLVFFTNLHSLK